MKTKLFTLLFAFVASVGFMQAAFVSGTCGAQGDNLTWGLDYDGLLTISGTGEMANYNSMGAPWYGNKDLISSVVFENGVTSIGEFAFDGCSNLTSVTIPNSVTIIQRAAFGSCIGLTSIEIPNSVISIKSEVFDLCNNLQTVYIGSGLSDIVPWSFHYCPGQIEFIVDADNTNFTSEDGVLFNKDKTALVLCPEGKQGSYTIPNSVTSIDVSAFESCLQLTSIIIPTSVTSIGNMAFALCSNLSSITCEAVTPPTLGSSVFGSVNKSIPVYVPIESIHLYKAADQWKDFTNILPIPQEQKLFSIQGLANDANLGQVIISKVLPYVGFTATEESSIKMLYGGTLVGAQPKLEYSYDGKFWSTFALNTVYPVATGQTFFMRGKNPNGVSIRFDGYSYFVMTGSLEGSGDIMSLVDSTFATTEAPKYCFYRLFYNCTALKSSPRLTATTLNSECYTAMFRGCTNLRYIDVDFTLWKGANDYYNYTENWLNEASSAGTFIKPAGLSIINGTSNIPSGWTVVNKETLSNAPVPTNTGSYESGSKIILTAEPKENCYFVQWSDGITTNPRSFVLTKDTTFTAVFERIETTVVIGDGENKNIDDLDNGTGSIETAIVEPGGELNINTAGISIDTLIIVADGFRSGQVYHTADITANHIFLEYILEYQAATASPDKWYAFAVPFEVDLNGGITRICDDKTLVSGTDFLVMEFDGAKRAQTGKGWKAKQTGTILPGQSYLIGIDGTCNNWRFERMANKPYEGDMNGVPFNSNPASNAKNTGWNGLGNTQLRYTSIADLANAGLQYVLTYDNRYSNYVTHLISDIDLFVGQPFFIQASANGSFNFQTVSQNSTNNIPLRAAKTQKPLMHFTLTNEKGDVGTDHLYLTLHDDATDTYTIGRDLARLSDECTTAAQLWCNTSDGTQLCAHGLTATATETIVPLGLFAPKQGEYQLELNTRAMEEYNVELLCQGAFMALLSDRQPVTLTLAKGTTNDYTLRLRRKVTTDVENVAAKLGGCQKMLIDGHLYILQGDHIYDAQGKMVK